MDSITTVCLVLAFLLALQVKAETTDTTTISSITDTTTIPSTPQTTTSCSPTPDCPSWDGCVLFYRPDGCVDCLCPNPSCQELNCPKGTKCTLVLPFYCRIDGVLEQPVHYRQHCVPMAVCSSIDTTTIPSTTDTTTIPSTTPTTPSCSPTPDCPSWDGCVLFYRPDGCVDCLCPNPSCQELNCPEGTKCTLVLPFYCRIDGVLEQPFHYRQHCVPMAVCSSIDTTTISSTTDTTTISSTTDTTTIPSTTPTTPSCYSARLCDSLVMYHASCYWTYRPDGCPDCLCQNASCQELNCPEGTECIPGPTLYCLLNWPCVSSAVCSSVDTTTISSSTTTSICLEDVVCGDGCVIVTNPGGCHSSCSCPPTCEGISCDLDEECVLQDDNCTTTPCFPQPICVPKQSSCAGNPKVDRCKVETGQQSGCVDRWTYNSTINACERFCYYGCTPSPANTFKSQRKCMAKCKVRHR